jgi:preprotein translocase subunit YajC
VPACSAQPTATASNRGTVPKEQPIIVNLLLIYIVVIGGVFIFMTSRGNRKRQSTAQQLQSALVVGATVRTIGGVVGEVVEVNDEHVVVETTPGVRLKFVKSAVAGVVPPAEPESEADEAEETEHADETEQDELAAEAGAETAEPSDAVPAHAAEADEAADHAASEPAKR